VQEQVTGEQITVEVDGRHNPGVMRGSATTWPRVAWGGKITKTEKARKTGKGTGNRRENEMVSCASTKTGGNCSESEM